MGTLRPAVQDRSRATRACLLDAAVACLVERGYSATTTIAVAEHAGVSRGAQLHHFPTRAALLTAAIEHLLVSQVEEFRRGISDLTVEDGDVGPFVDTLIDRLWPMFQGPTFVAFTELWMAARTDPELAAAMIDVERRFTEQTRLLAVELIGGLASLDPARVELVRDVAFAVMDGVAFQRLVPRGQRPAADYLDVLKSLARQLLAPPEDGEG